jgi:ribose-phosphate pyrophosphokinase
MDSTDLALFALNASRPFGVGVAAELGVSLSEHEEREFDDGEHKSRPLVNIRGRDAFVIQSLYADANQSVNDKLVRLLFFLATLKDASAGHVTAIVPYLAYARKDAKTQPRDPVTTRYVAQLFEAVGVDRVVTLDVHNVAAFQNAYRCRTDHLETTRLFVEHFTPMLLKENRIAVVSPDIGGVKRAARFHQALTQATKKELDLAFIEKTRARGVLRLGRLVDDIADGSAIIIDDMIGTGSTLAHAARACRDQGAKNVYAAATHGLFHGRAGDILKGPDLDKVIVTDTVPPFRLDPGLVKEKLTVLSTARLFAEAVGRIHSGGSLVELHVT